MRKGFTFELIMIDENPGPDARKETEPCSAFPMLKAEIESSFRQLPGDVISVHWKWRYEMARAIAEHPFLNGKNVKAVYILGSVKNAESGPASDIDLIIHYGPDNSCLNEIREFLCCWAQCLSEVNFRLTGERVGEMLDVHYASDSDMEDRNSYTTMIGSHHNSARLLKKFGD